MCSLSHTSYCLLLCCACQHTLSLSPHSQHTMNVVWVSSHFRYAFFRYGWSQYISNMLLSLLFESHSWSQSYFLSQCCDIKYNMNSTLHFFVAFDKKKLLLVSCHLCIYTFFVLIFKEVNILKFSINKGTAQ